MYRIKRMLSCRISTADLFLRDCQHEQKGLVGESNIFINQSIFAKTFVTMHHVSQINKIVLTLQSTFIKYLL